MAVIYRDPYTGRFVSKQNYKILVKAFDKYKKDVKKYLVQNVRALAPKFISGIDQFSVPYDTGNLHDSIGVGLFKEGRMLNLWHTDPQATVAQHWGTFNGLIARGKGFGKDYLQRVQKNMESEDYEMETAYIDVSMVLFVAIPYAAPLSDPNGVKEAAKRRPKPFYPQYSHPMHEYYKNWFPKMRSAFIKACSQGIRKSFIEGSDEFGGWSTNAGKTDPLRFELNLEFDE